MKQSFRVADGVNWVNGQPVPRTRVVELSEREALHELAAATVKRIRKPSRRPRRKAGDRDGS